MRVREAVDNYLIAKQFLQFKTLRGYRWMLGLFSEWCEGEKLELEQVQAIHVRHFLAEHRGQSNHTLRGFTRTIKTFLTWSSREYDGIVSEKLVSRIEMPRLDKTVIEIFTEDEIKRLLKSCDKEDEMELRVQDRAILHLLLDTGIRASEICYDDSRPSEPTGLRMEQLFIGSREPYIRVFGKGRKEREVGIGKRTKYALRKYIKDYRGDSPSSYVFLSRNSEPFTVRGLEAMLTRLGEWADVKDCHPHKFRHSSACMYLERGGDIYTLSRRLGHVNTKVTEMYLRAIQDKQARKGLSVVDALLNDN